MDKPTQFTKWTPDVEKYFRTWAEKWVQRNTYINPPDVAQEMVLRAWSVYDRNSRGELSEDVSDINFVIRAMINKSLSIAQEDKRDRGRHVPISIIRGGTTSSDGIVSVVSDGFEDADDDMFAYFGGYVEHMSDEEEERRDLGMIGFIRSVVKEEERMDMVRIELGEKPVVLPKVRDGVEMFIRTLEGFTREEICEEFQIPLSTKTRVYRLIKEAREKLDLDYLIVCAYEELHASWK